MLVIDPRKHEAKDVCAYKSLDMCVHIDRLISVLVHRSLVYIPTILMPLYLMQLLAACCEFHASYQHRLESEIRQKSGAGSCCISSRNIATADVALAATVQLDREISINYCWCRSLSLC